MRKFSTGSAATSTARLAHATSLPSNGLILINDPKPGIPRLMARFICLLAMGTTSLDRVIQITSTGQEEDFRIFKDDLLARVSNMNVVSGLTLATTAAFLTTNPPTEALNWNKDTPYIFILAALCLAYLGVVSGTFLLFVLSDIQSVVFRNLMQKPWRFWCALFLIGGPLIFVGLSGVAAITGLCLAAWEGNNVAAKVGVTFTYGFTVVIIASFLMVLS